MYKDYRLSEIKAICTKNVFTVSCNNCEVQPFCCGDMENNLPRDWNIEEKMTEHDEEIRKKEAEE